MVQRLVFLLLVSFGSLSYRQIVAIVTENSFQTDEPTTAYEPSLDNSLDTNEQNSDKNHDPRELQQRSLHNGHNSGHSGPQMNETSQHHSGPSHHSHSQGQCQGHTCSPLFPELKSSYIFEQIKSLALSGRTNINTSASDIIYVVLARCNFEQRVDAIVACGKFTIKELYFKTAQFILQRNQDCNSQQIFHEQRFSKFAANIVEFILKFDQHMNESVCMKRNRTARAHSSYHGQTSFSFSRQSNYKNAMALFREITSHYNRTAIPKILSSPLEYRVAAHANRLLCVNEFIVRALTDTLGRGVNDWSNLRIVYQAFIGFIVLGYQIGDSRTCPVHFIQELIQDLGHGSTNTMDENGLNRLMGLLSDRGFYHAPNGNQRQGHKRNILKYDFDRNYEGITNPLSTAESIPEPSSEEYYSPSADIQQPKRSSQSAAREGSIRDTDDSDYDTQTQNMNTDAESIGQLNRQARFHGQQFQHSPNSQEDTGHSDHSCDVHQSHLPSSKHTGHQQTTNFLNVRWPYTTGPQKTCYGPDKLMKLFFGKSGGRITADEFQDICPALLNQMVYGTCAQQWSNHRPEQNHHQSHPTPSTIQTDSPFINSTNTTTPKHTTGLKKWKGYLYGSLSVLVISLSSLLGGVFVKVSSPAVKLYLLPCLLALAVGCLVADAALHLLPEVLMEEEQVSGEGDEVLSVSLYRMCAFLGSIYAFFLLELIMTRLGGGHSHDTEHQSSNSHVQIQLISVQPIQDEENRNENNVNNIPLNNIIEARKNNALTTASDTSGSPHTIQLNNFTTLDKKNSNKSNNSNGHKNKDKGVKNLALMVMVGDGIHNVADGLAIGAAFALSFSTGLSTAITVLCHEIPHELGDFAVLLSTGISIRRAMLFNFLCSLTSFAGLFAGLSAGAQEDADKWIFSVGAGMFLYVALTNLIPECKEIYKKTPRTAMFMALNFGILLGYSVMLLMAIFEDKLTL